MGNLGHRSHRFTINPCRRNRHQFLFGVPERGQPAAEDTARIDVDGAVEPSGFHDRGMAVDHHGLPAIGGRPVGAYRETELIRFPGSLAIEAEVPDAGRRPALVVRLQPCMGHHQLPVIEHVVADQSIQERSRPLLKLRGLRFQLGKRCRQSMGNPHLPALEFADELGFVIARHTKRRAVRSHGHRQIEHLGDGRTPVHEIADE